MKVTRQRLVKGGPFFDSSALPCPRCRNEHPRCESWPACGMMASCANCGGRSTLEAWNDGEIQYTAAGRAYEPNAGQRQFARPATDVIEVLDEPRYPHAA